MQHTYSLSGMHCASCVQKIQSALANVPGVQLAQVTLDPPQAVVTMERHIPVERLDAAVRQAGNYQLSEPESAAAAMPAPAESSQTTYFPLFLLLAYLIGLVVIRQLLAPTWNWTEAMADFMGGFFLVFSFFKLLDLRAFAAAYSSYDVIAKRWLTYGYIYPFLELGLGAAYFARLNPFVTNIATLALMLVSLIGVIQTLAAKRKIRCACLGTVFNLPMSTITLIEDGGMAAMAAAMLMIQH